MPDFYTRAIPLVNQSEEIGEKQLSVFVSRGGQISPLMHISFVVSAVSFSLSHWYPGSGVVLDCIDS